MMALTCKETTTTTRMTNLKIRFAGKDKYPDKVRVWVAISNRGISKPLFRPSKSKTVNSNIYINENITSFHS